MVVDPDSYEAFMKLKKRKTGVNPSSVGEIDRYLSLPQVDDEVSPTNWWNTNQKRFPILARIARDYFSVQSSSVPSERLFSSGVDLVTPKRCRLSGLVIEKTQYLKYALSKRTI